MNSDPKKSQQIERFTLKDELPDQGEAIAPASFTPSTQIQQQRHWQINKRTILFGAIGLLAASVGLLLFLAKSVIIETEPAVAEVTVLDHLAVPFKNSFLMLPGEAKLEISAPGYQTRLVDIVVDSTPTQQLAYELEKLPGHITFSHEKAAGEVWLNNNVVGELNQEISALPPGDYEFTIITERYLPKTLQVSIAGLDTHQIENVELIPAWAAVTLSSSPQGATVFVDGEAVGTTPLQADIVQGERELSMTLPGHKAWQYFVDVRAGDTVEIPAVTLEKADGLLNVTSSPANASITINGQYMGTTPAQLSLAPGKQYAVTLFKSGFKPTTAQAMVESAQNNQLAVELKAEYGDVKVMSTPSDALVYVNGRLMGRSQQTLTLPAVQSTIEFKREGYANFQTVILPKPGIEQRVTASLLTTEQAKWQKIPEQITTSLGQQLLLMKPDAEFTMGSSRREQGRRANEPQRDVKLTRPFYLAKTEVTNKDFKKFMASHSSSHIKGNSLDIPNHPVVNITWEQAARFCNWLSEKENLPVFYQIEEDQITGFNPQATGYRMPTEVEWAWAARYENGTMLKYPWGAQMPPTEKSGNYADRNAAPVAGFIQPQYDDGYVASSPVGAFPPNSKGIYDLGGNVSEWVNDYYEIQTGLSLKTDVDPMGPASGDFHVIRGASWAHGNITELRLSYRGYSNAVQNDVGFRLARFLE